MEIGMGCESLCREDACLTGAGKRSRKPDMPIYVPKQMRERQQKAQEDQASFSPVRSCTAVNLKSTSLTDRRSPVKTIASTVSSRNSPSASRKATSGSELNSESKFPHQSKAADTPISSDQANDKSDCAVAKSGDNRCLTIVNREADNAEEDLAGDLASKCGLVEDDSGSEKVPATKSTYDSDRQLSDDDDSTGDRWLASNAAEVDGFPAEFDERDVRKLVQINVERIVWVNDTRCVCVLECGNPEADGAGLIDILRSRLANEWPQVLIKPLSEADASSKRKWFFVEKHRRFLRHGADSDKLPPRPRTSAVVANRMILRALGRSADQHSSAPDE